MKNGSFYTKPKPNPQLLCLSVLSSEYMLHENFFCLKVGIWATTAEEIPKSPHLPTLFYRVSGHKKWNEVSCMYVKHNTTKTDRLPLILSIPTIYWYSPSHTTIHYPNTYTFLTYHGPQVPLLPLFNVFWYFVLYHFCISGVFEVKWNDLCSWRTFQQTQFRAKLEIAVEKHLCM